MFVLGRERLLEARRDGRLVCEVDFSRVTEPKVAKVKIAIADKLRISLVLGRQLSRLAFGGVIVFGRTGRRSLI